MSSGDAGIAVVPIGAIVVVAAAPFVLAAGAAVLLARAAGAATELLAAGLVSLGEEMERQARDQDETARATRLWRCAAQNVLAVNAKLTVVSERAASAGAAVAVPAPLDMAGLCLEDVRDWVSRTEAQLPELRLQVDRAMTATETARVMSQLPPAVASTPSAAELIRQFQKELDGRQRRAVPPAAVDRSAEIARALARLEPDANARDRADVLEAAAKAGTETDAGMARTHLDEVRFRVDRVNDRVADRRLAAVWLRGLEGAAGAVTPRPPFLDVTAKLRAVVRGERELTQEVRDETARSVATAERLAERRLVLAVAREELINAGFDVLGEDEGKLYVGLEDWGDEHAAQVFVHDGRLRGEMLRLLAGGDDQAERVDKERCEEFTGGFRKVGQGFRRRGITAEEPVMDSSRPTLTESARIPRRSQVDVTKLKERTADPKVDRR